jgi:hypothetical protein
MLATLYLLLSLYVGCYVSLKITSFLKVHIENYFYRWILVSLAFPIGLMLITSWVYIFYYLFKNTSHALLFANLTLLAPLILLLKIFPLNWSKDPCWYSAKMYPETYFFFFILIIGSFLFFSSINQHFDVIEIGSTVHSDFGPHTAMIRSFSIGKNVPTDYPLFASSGVRYHFLFYFLCGNLEYLGFNLPMSLNVSSLLTFVSAFMLFFIFIRIATKNYAIAWLTVLFFLFRSSPAFLTKLAAVLKKQATWNSLFYPSQFIALTENEHWGLWGINIWANQRHLSTGFSVLILILIFMWVIYFPKSKNSNE